MKGEMDFYHRKRCKSMILAKERAKRICKILHKNLTAKPHLVLDDGCGTGDVTKELAKLFNCRIIGLELSEKDVKTAKYKIDAVLGDGTKLPFRSECFDIVISYQVIEHVNDQKYYLAEIYRVLKPRGLLYLATPNKHFPIEQHYLLPFLTYLPKRIANYYLKITRRGSSYEHINCLSRKQIIKMLSEMFEVREITSEIIAHPEKYGIGGNKIFHKIAGVKYISKLSGKMTPSFIFVARKREDKQ